VLFADSDLVTAALRFARRVHLGQHRKQTYEQFVEHPIEVARLLAEQGYDGPILAAAYLHDTLKKTRAAGGDAVLIYAADRLANMRDWHTLPPDRREACAARLGTELDERLLLWGEDLEALRGYEGRLPFLDEIERELNALRA
jgi:(p)ppGpp synthase/HD superfamily hydrolase